MVIATNSTLPYYYYTLYIKAITDVVEIVERYFQVRL